MDNILSVRELTERLRRMVEQRFPFVWVRGETTNLSRPSSGHLYFSLREGADLLNCVWFRGQQRESESFAPLTGEVWEGGPRPGIAATLENGREIICAGRLSVYGPRGGHQLIVELAQEAGQGLLAAALEELKRKPLHAQLLEDRVFRLAVCIRRTGMERRYEVEELPW